MFKLGRRVYTESVKERFSFIQRTSLHLLGKCSTNLLLLLIYFLFRTCLWCINARLKARSLPGSLSYSAGTSVEGALLDVHLLIL